MSNITTNDRFWTLDTVAVIVAVGIPVTVRKIVFYPAAVNNVAVIQEYLASGALATAMQIKAGPTAVDLVSLDFGPKGRKLNGFKLSTITAGTLDVYLGED